MHPRMLSALRECSDDSATCATRDRPCTVNRTFSANAQSCGIVRARDAQRKRSALKFSINGRFLSQSLTGVQRYAAEMVKAMDHLLASKSAPPQLLDAEWQILTPPNAQMLAGLRRIQVKQVGTLQGHAWDQIDLARAAAGTRLVSLANSGPVLHRNHLVVLHDAQVFRRPDFFSWRYLAPAA